MAEKKEKEVKIKVKPAAPPVKVVFDAGIKKNTNNKKTGK